MPNRLTREARVRLLAAVALLVLVGLALFGPLPVVAGASQRRYIAVSARQFAFSPGVIQVSRGDTVTLDLEASDSVHGLYLDGYGIDLVAEPGHRARATFVADEEGKFTFRCSVTCGNLHPFMVGELEVQPNLPFARVGLATLAVVFASLALWRPAGSLAFGQGAPAEAGSLPSLPRRETGRLPRLPSGEGGGEGSCRTTGPRPDSLLKVQGAAGVGSCERVPVGRTQGVPVGGGEGGWQYDLARWPLLKRVLGSRWLQWGLTTAMLPFFVLAVTAGLVGTPAGNRNFAIVFVWIVWWAVLMLLLVPFGGRFWCVACPIPAPGEWLQRRAVLVPRPGARLSTLGWRWPKRLHNIWLQNASFLAVALFSAVILTRPAVTAWLLLAMVATAIVSSLLFERRVFCRYLCPVGGFVGLYAQVSPLAVRVRDRRVCKGHKEKTCYSGCDAGYGCPWLLFPGALERNNDCGLCTECFKTCPLHNVALYLRPFGADLVAGRRVKLDEAYKALIMLTSALLYSGVLLGPWAILKETAQAIGSPAWFAYAGAFLLANLVLVPGLFYGCGLLAKRLGGGNLSSRALFATFSQALVPLGLAAWCAFSLSLVFANGSYAWPVLSDPFGWGWDLFGTAAWGWTPYTTRLLPYLQALVLWLGLAGALVVTQARTHGLGLRRLAAAPVVAFCAVYALAFLGLYLG